VFLILGHHQKVNSNSQELFYQLLILLEPKDLLILLVVILNLDYLLNLPFCWEKLVLKKQLLLFYMLMDLLKNYSKEWIFLKLLLHKCSKNTLSKYAMLNKETMFIFLLSEKSLYFLLMISICQLLMSGKIKSLLKLWENLLKTVDSGNSKDNLLVKKSI